MHDRAVFDRYLTIAEERQLLATVAGRAGVYAARDHAWMRLLRHTGIRVGSAARLTCADVREALRSGYLYVRPIKRSPGGRIYLNRRARQSLTDLLRVRREMGHGEQPEAPLIMSREHAGMSVRSFQHRMRYWVREAGLQVDASPHWWRHTLAKRLMRQSTAADPRGIAQRALLHAHITTSAIYTGPDREDYEMAMEEAS